MKLRLKFQHIIICKSPFYFLFPFFIVKNVFCTTMCFRYKFKIVREKRECRQIKYIKNQIQPTMNDACPLNSFVLSYSRLDLLPYDGMLRYPTVQLHDINYMIINLTVRSHEIHYVGTRSFLCLTMGICMQYYVCHVWTPIYFMVLLSSSIKDVFLLVQVKV